MIMEKKYKSVIVQIVGSTGKWDYAYYPDDEEFNTHQEARKNGEKIHGHDDFITAEFVDGIARCPDCGSDLVALQPEVQKNRKTIPPNFIKRLLIHSGVGPREVVDFIP